MPELSKVALQVDNNQSFPNNNNGYITPAILRSYNTNIIDSTVNQIQYTTDSGSLNYKVEVLSAQTGSYLTTGSNTFRGTQIITGSVTVVGSLTASFLAGDGSGITNVNQSPISNLNAFTQSQESKDLTLATYTGSNDTKWTTLGSTTSSFSSSVAQLNAFTASTDTKFTTLGFSTSSLNAYTASNDTKWSTLSSVTASFSASVKALNQFTESQYDKDFYVGVFTGSQDTKNATLAAYTASINTYTQSVDSKFTTIGLLTGSFATTGSNSFAGVQSINYASGSGLGEVYLLGDSGSLVIGTSTLTPTYAALAHLSSSAVNGNVNIIIKNSTTAADTIISGSGNIFVNPAAPTAGFKRYIGTSNIYPHGNSAPQISGSMAWSPTTNGNIISNTLGNAVTWRGPVSSSQSGFNSNIIMGGTINLGTSAANNFEKAVAGASIIGNALFNGTLNQVANTTTLSTSVATSGNLIFGGLVALNHISSSTQYNSNVTNGSTTVNNRYFPISGSSAAVTAPRTNTNTLYGTGHVINFDGTNVSATQGKAFTFNILAGTFLTASVPDGDACSVNATGMIGNGLIVTGSTLQPVFAGADAANSGQGSLFSGRFNSVNGTADMTAETVFAVGTGTSYSNRKTGFLIDSGSNTFIEGTLNVSGGVYQNVVPITIASQTASLDLTKGTYFTPTLADNTTTHIRPTNLAAGVSATLVITTGTNSSASLAPILLQPTGNAYVVTDGSGKIDVLSLTSTNASNMFVVSAKNMI